MKGKRTVD